MDGGIEAEVKQELPRVERIIEEFNTVGARELLKRMRASAVALLICSPHFGDDIKSLSELGAAIMCDKAILVVKHKHFTFPDQFDGIVYDYEEYDSKESLGPATMKLLKRNDDLFKREIEAMEKEEPPLNPC